MYFNWLRLNKKGGKPELNRIKVIKYGHRGEITKYEQAVGGMRRLLLSAAIDYDKAMQNISTKTGDKGETSLADGRRVSKADLRVRVVGDLDELNSWLGVVVSHLGDAFTEQRQFLKTIQQDLFTLGAEIALADTEQVDQIGRAHV